MRDGTPSRTGRLGWLRGLPFLIVITVVGVGCGPVASATGEPSLAATAGGLISPVQLEALLATTDPFLVNVHVPYEGELAGTDGFVPFDTVATNAATFPADRSALIVVYCRSGSMSAIAGQVLADLGYKNVLDLAGGMIAWRAQGFEVVDRGGG